MTCNLMQQAVAELVKTNTRLLRSSNVHYSVHEKVTGLYPLIRDSQWAYPEQAESNHILVMLATIRSRTFCLLVCCLKT
jgi:hypothetical protein